MTTTQSRAQHILANLAEGYTNYNKVAQWLAQELEQALQSPESSIQRAAKDPLYRFKNLARQINESGKGFRVVQAYLQAATDSLGAALDGLVEGAEKAEAAAAKNGEGEEGQPSMTDRELKHLREAIDKLKRLMDRFREHHKEVGRSVAEAERDAFGKLQKGRTSKDPNPTPAELELIEQAGLRAIADKKYRIPKLG